MSLLVHELLIGTGGGRGSSHQTSPTSVSIASVVPVSHSNGTVQFSQLQNNRVVKITSHSRASSNEKGSRLADALAGNPPYSYSSSHYFPRAPITQRQPVSQVVISPNVALKQSPQVQSQRSSRQSYILPFVLQDHNYGAPPPSSPPHSPPQSNTIPNNYKVHKNVSPVKPNVTSSKSTFSNGQKSSVRKVVSEQQSIVTLNNVGNVQITSTSNGTIIGPASSTVVSSPFMATMPLHRQQFMPHPKTTVFPSPQSRAPKGGDTTNHCIASPDTDEESRLSDRSSSAGPSGEETETAPEGEGEEIQSDDSITRCICGFAHDDGYMIQCDRCFVWQHVDCMSIDRTNIPDEYLCEACLPRKTDKYKARNLQVKRRQEIKAHLSRLSSSDSDDNSSSVSKIKLGGGSSFKSQDKKVLKKKKPRPAKENKKSRRLSGPGKLVSSNFPPICNGTEELKLSSVDLIKTRRRQSTGNSVASVEDCTNNNINNNNNSSSVDQLRSWIEDYEIAVTNHYSPELRARVHSARINGISPEFRESTQGAMLGYRCRVAPSYNVKAETFEHKVLVAATRLNPGTAIIEYQGKYTLKSQWNAAQVLPGMTYLPFVLQYNMEKEGLHVCIDARTYGNDARFSRRSNNSNAEIRHVVERGSVHLFIVASKEIEEEDEIVLSLETAICLQQQPVTKESVVEVPVPVPVAVPVAVPVQVEKIEEQIVTPISPPSSPIRKNGTMPIKKCSRKPLLALSLPQPLNRTTRRTTSGDEDVIPQVKLRRSSACSRSPIKSSQSPMKSPCKSPPSNNNNKDDESGGDSSAESHKMTRDERKIAAYMKAFERMERAAQRKEKRKGELRKNSDDDEDESRNEPWDDKGCKKGKKNVKDSPEKIKNEMNENFCSDNTGSASEGDRPKTGDSAFYGSPPSGSISNSGFRFPKTKKALMNEWLNETVDPVMHYSTIGEIASGVPTCYMRSPSTPRRGQGVAATSNGQQSAPVDMFGRSAKKRWLRQAIIDETEPLSCIPSFCSSPNSRPDSPLNDYITPLKKRRLARESISSEQSNTPPSTPAHSSLEEEKFNEEMELEHNFCEKREVNEFITPPRTELEGPDLPTNNFGSNQSNKSEFTFDFHSTTTTTEDDDDIVINKIKKLRSYQRDDVSSPSNKKLSRRRRVKSATVSSKKEREAKIKQTTCTLKSFSRDEEIKTELDDCKKENHEDSKPIAVHIKSEQKLTVENDVKLSLKCDEPFSNSDPDTKMIKKELCEETTKIDVRDSEMTMKSSLCKVKNDIEEKIKTNSTIINFNKEDSSDCLKNRLKKSPHKNLKNDDFGDEDKSHKIDEDLHCDETEVKSLSAIDENIPGDDTELDNSSLKKNKDDEFDEDKLSKSNVQIDDEDKLSKSNVKIDDEDKFNLETETKKDLNCDDVTESKIENDANLCTDKFKSSHKTETGLDSLPENNKAPDCEEVELKKSSLLKEKVAETDDYKTISSPEISENAAECKDNPVFLIINSVIEIDEHEPISPPKSNKDENKISKCNSFNDSVVKDQSSTIEYSQKDVNEFSLKMKDVNEFPLKMKEVNEFPLKIKDLNEFPLKMKEVNEFPLKMKEVNEFHLKMKDANEFPLKMKEVSEFPLKMKDANELPLKMKEDSNCVSLDLLKSSPETVVKEVENITESKVDTTSRPSVIHFEEKDVKSLPKAPLSTVVDPKAPLSTVVEPKAPLSTVVDPKAPLSTVVQNSLTTAIMDSAAKSAQVESASNLEEIVKHPNAVAVEDSSIVPVTKAPKKLIPIKRKLSILEYRKRKSVSSESDNGPMSRDKVTTRASFDYGRLETKSTSPLLAIVKIPEEDRPITEQIDVDLSFSSSNSSMIDFILDEQQSGQAPKWSDEPTLLEKQRETLTARLRKEFGLSVPDKTFDLEERTLSEKLADIEKRLTLSEKIKTTSLSLSVTPPSFPRVKLSDKLLPKTDPD